MEKNIVDPNQLNLFEGMILTPEQQQAVDNFIQRKKESAENSLRVNRLREKMLVDAGFVKGKDFVNEFSIKTVTQPDTFIRYINGEPFRTEVTFQNRKGCIMLKGIQHFKGEITDKTYNICFEGDKIECYGLTENFRKIKSNTLLRKLKEENARAFRQQEAFNESSKLLKDTIDKYQKLYPQAEIIHSGEGYYNATLKIKFPSGSSVTLQITSRPGGEILRGKVDVESDGLDKETLLDKFSKQSKNLDS